VINVGGRYSINTKYKDRNIVFGNSDLEPSSKSMLFMNARLRALCTFTRELHMAGLVATMPMMRKQLKEQMKLTPKYWNGLGNSCSVSVSSCKNLIKGKH
jgi:hypothetical protein